MLFLEVITWWYGAGWRDLIKLIESRVRGMYVAFSVPLLLKTMFSPWRRIISYGDNSFVEGIRAALDNTVSRFVGFGVRLIVLITALLLILLLITASLFLVILWPLLPLLSLVLIVRGLIS